MKYFEHASIHISSSNIKPTVVKYFEHDSNRIRHKNDVNAVCFRFNFPWFPVAGRCRANLKYTPWPSTLEPSLRGSARTLGSACREQDKGWANNLRSDV